MDDHDFDGLTEATAAASAHRCIYDLVDYYSGDEWVLICYAPECGTYWRTGIAAASSQSLAKLTAAADAKYGGAGYVRVKRCRKCWRSEVAFERGNRVCRECRKAANRDAVWTRRQQNAA